MSAGDVVAIIGAVAVALTALTGVLTYRWGRGKTRAEEALASAQARKVEAEARQVEAEAAAAEAQASLEKVAGRIDTRFDAIESRLQTVVHEVTPNHGGSIKDAVKRLEEESTRDREEQREWRRSLGHRLDGISAQLESEAQDRRAADQSIRDQLNHHAN